MNMIEEINIFKFIDTLEIINNSYHINKDFKYCSCFILMGYLLLIKKLKNGNILLHFKFENINIYLRLYFQNIFLS